jgi:hypothetical protein
MGEKRHMGMHKPSYCQISAPFKIVTFKCNKMSSTILEKSDNFFLFSQLPAARNNRKPKKKHAFAKDEEMTTAFVPDCILSVQ